MKTLEKIEAVLKTNFQKKEMDALWNSKVSDSRRFCDIFYALAYHQKNNDNQSFDEKIKKTALSLNISILTFTPFMIKYFIIKSAYNTAQTNHINKLAKLSQDNQLDEKTNIKDVIQRKNTSTKNNFHLSDDKKSIIDNTLQNIDFTNYQNYIQLLDELIDGISDKKQNIDEEINFIVEVTTAGFYATEFQNGKVEDLIIPLKHDNEACVANLSIPFKDYESAEAVYQSLCTATTNDDTSIYLLEHIKGDSTIDDYNIIKRFKVKPESYYMED